MLLFENLELPILLFEDTAVFSPELHMARNIHDFAVKFFCCVLDCGRWKQ
jgi:hypothetical protein